MRHQYFRYMKVTQLNLKFLKWGIIISLMKLLLLWLMRFKGRFLIFLKNVTRFIRMNSLKDRFWFRIRFWEIGWILMMIYLFKLMILLIYLNKIAIFLVWSIKMKKLIENCWNNSSFPIKYGISLTILKEIKINLL